MKSKLLTIALVTILIFLISGIAFAAGLTDIGGHWAKSQIEKMVATGAITGFPDGSFKPDQQITRAQFTTIVNKAFGKVNKNAAAAFSDVNKTDWFYEQVAIGTTAGFISGYPDNTFKPDKTITREEAAAILAKLHSFGTSNTSAINSFTDKGNIADWAKGSVAAVVYSKVMNGYPDGSFKPKNSMTRAEAVVSIGLALEASKQPPSTGGGASGGSSGSGGGGGGDTSGGGGSDTSGVTAPTEVASFTAVTDPLGDTLVKVIIKSESANNVKKVMVKGQDATLVSGSMTEWRVTLDGQAQVTGGEIKVVSVTAVTDPLGDTLVIIRPSFVATTVTVRGQAATKVGDYEWRITVDGSYVPVGSDIVAQ